MKHGELIKKVFPLVLLLALTLVLFYKVFFGLYPYAGNLLVSFFFPWSGGGFEGYNSWTTHKEFIASDSIRMQLPWKVFAFDQIKKAQAPLWNPYNFSGSPLLANYQSGLFYPLNLLYLFFHPLIAWSAITILQVFLAMVFMFLLLRKFKISQPASLLGSLAFVSSSFFIMWIEIDIIGHAYLWLPLIVYFIELILSEKKRYYYPAISLAIALSVFAGYPQTAILVIFYTIVYFLFRLWSLAGEKKELLILAFFVVLGFGLAAAQLLPTLELYQQAPLSQGFARWTFEYFLIPYHQLASFFAPDFFGNPATGNFWGKDYGDLTPSLGMIPLFFALLPLFLKRKDRLFKFFYLSGLFFLLLAIKSPVSSWVMSARVPILSSSNPGRILSLLFFNLALLSAFGFDFFLNQLSKAKKDWPVKFLIAVFGLIYLSFWAFILFGPRVFNLSPILVGNLSVAKRNLILPTGGLLLLLGIFVSSFFFRRAKFFRFLAILAVIVFVFLSLFYRFHKYNPFSPKKFFFPSHPIIDFLKSKSTIPDRFYGVETAHFGSNFATYYQVYSAEGYDALRIRRYGELIASVEEGKVPEEYLRSDAVFPGEDSPNRRRIFNLLGIKYILDKDDAAKGPWDPQPWKYPQERYQLTWQKEKWKVYENLEALPRAFLVSDYLVIESGEEILEKLYSADFDPSQTVIIEEELSSDLVAAKTNQGKTEIVSYQPNRVEIKTESQANSLLVFSDSFYPGWQAYLDGKGEKIYRANYAFRTVLVPSGEHQVLFSYEPEAFKLGKIFSGTAFFGLLLLTGYFLKKKR